MHQNMPQLRRHCDSALMLLLLLGGALKEGGTLAQNPSNGEGLGGDVEEAVLFEPSVWPKGESHRRDAQASESLKETGD